MLFAYTLDQRGPAQDTVTAVRAFVSSLGADFPDYALVATGRLTAQQIQDAETGKGFALSDGVGLPFIVRGAQRLGARASRCRCTVRAM